MNTVGYCIGQIPNGLKFCAKTIVNGGKSFYSSGSEVVSDIGRGTKKHYKELAVGAGIIVCLWLLLKSNVHDVEESA